MPLSRRRFFQSSAIAAATAALSPRLLALEPPRVRPAGGAILLNSNENAFGPFPSVRKAMIDALDVANRYPDYEFDALWAALSKLHGVKEDQIVVGCGSTDILRMSAEAMCGRTKTILTAAPTFEALAMYGARRGVKTITVPLRKDFSHDLEAMAAKAKAGVDLIYICNPNNPTASITPRKEIEAFLAQVPQETYVMIDEAYHHFAVKSDGYLTFADAAHAPQHPRTFVARTFSKIFAMAGMRVGYAVGPKEVIAELSKNYVFDNPNCMAARGAVAGVNDTAAMEASVKVFADARAEYMRQAMKRKLAVIPSHANFLMMETGRPVRKVIDHFKANGVMVGRPFPPYETHLRVSIGLPEEMQTFWQVWDKMA